MLAGIALLLVAAAWPFLLRRLPTRRPVLRAVALVVLVAKPLVLGLLVLGAPVVGVLPRSASPVLLIAGDRARPRRARLRPDHVEPPRWPTTSGCWSPRSPSGWSAGSAVVLDALIFGLLAPEADVPPGSGLLTGVVVMICGGGIARAHRHRAGAAATIRCCPEPP